MATLQCAAQPTDSNHLLLQFIYRKWLLLFILLCILLVLNFFLHSGFILAVYLATVFKIVWALKTSLKTAVILYNVHISFLILTYFYNLSTQINKCWICNDNFPNIGKYGFCIPDRH
jgi:hypothetical protein